MKRCFVVVFRFENLIALSHLCLQFFFQIKAVFSVKNVFNDAGYVLFVFIQNQFPLFSLVLNVNGLLLKRRYSFEAILSTLLKQLLVSNNVLVQTILDRGQLSIRSIFYIEQLLSLNRDRCVVSPYFIHLNILVWTVVTFMSMRRWLLAGILLSPFISQGLLYLWAIMICPFIVRCQWPYINLLFPSALPNPFHTDCNFPYPVLFTIALRNNMLLILIYRWLRTS